MTRHLLITNDYLPKTGGIQVYLHELWRRLPSGEAAILTANSDPGAKEFDAKSEVVIERIPEGTLFLPTRKIRKYIEEAIARHDPELVILDPAWPLGLLGPKLSRPYGVILHGAEVTIPGRLPFTGASLRYILRNAELAICAGTYPEAEARRNAAEFMPAVVQVPPGVDLERFVPLTKAQREKTRAELDIPEGALVVASYSRLVPRKGMDVLIEASVQLKNEFPNLLVMIGGKGRDAKRLNNLATKLNAPVRFLGRVVTIFFLPGLGRVTFSLWRVKAGGLASNKKASGWSLAKLRLQGFHKSPGALVDRTRLSVTAKQVSLLSVQSR